LTIFLELVVRGRRFKAVMLASGRNGKACK
jgi:hypothetical protein